MYFLHVDKIWSFLFYNFPSMVSDRLLNKEFIHSFYQFLPAVNTLLLGQVGLPSRTLFFLLAQCLNSFLLPRPSRQPSTYLLLCKYWPIPRVGQPLGTFVFPNWFACRSQYADTYALTLVYFLLLISMWHFFQSLEQSSGSENTSSRQHWPKILDI